MSRKEPLLTESPEQASEVSLALAALARLPGYFVAFRALRGPEGDVSDLRLELVNDFLADALGNAPEALRGRTYFELADPGDRESYELRLATLADGRPRTRERYSTTVGRWLRAHFFLVAPDVVGALSFDVTAEVKARDASEAAQRELLETQRVAQVGSWVRDLVRGTATWSDEIYRMHGLSPGDPIPGIDGIAAFYEPESVRLISAAFEKLGTAGEPYEVLIRLKPGAGRARAMIARGEAVRGADGRIVLVRGTVVDASERVEAEQGLSELRAELALVSRRTVLGEIASSLAHELNQPLAAILSSAETVSRLIRGGNHSCDDVLEILDDVAAQTERAAEVIRRLRGQLRRETQAPEALDLNQLVREALQLTATEARHRGATATLELAESLPPVFGDRVQLQQVLINLFLNALDAAEKTLAPRGATIRTWVEAGYVSLSVSDSGPGIPDALLERVFEPFYSTKPGGLGVGLALSRTLAEAHGGTLKAANAPGGGAVFVLTLPAAPATAGPEGTGR